VLLAGENHKSIFANSKFVSSTLQPLDGAASFAGNNHNATRVDTNLKSADPAQVPQRALEEEIVSPESSESGCGRERLPMSAQCQERAAMSFF
jgi:hypothetical protein